MFEILIIAGFTLVICLELRNSASLGTVFSANNRKLKAEIKTLTENIEKQGGDMSLVLLAVIINCFGVYVYVKTIINS